MAAEDRPPPQHLTFLAAAQEGLTSSGLFPLLRGAESRAPTLPRVGRSKRPDQNIVDLKHVPAFVFPARTLESVTITAGRAKVSGYWLGLTGPMGPLPTHLTEYAAYERRYAKTQPFGDFLDLLGGRMLQLYYRSWADSQPAAHADREETDQFAVYLAALSGARQATLCRAFRRPAERGGARGCADPPARRRSPRPGVPAALAAHRGAGPEPPRTRILDAGQRCR